MLRSFRKFIMQPEVEIKSADVPDLSLAVCVLLLEAAHTDGEFSDEEEQHVISTIEQRFSLTPEDAHALIQEAANHREKSLDLWRFTNHVCETHDRAERKKIIEEIWRVIYADDTLDAHEDYLVHKLTKLLRLTHSEMIAAKVKILQETREK